MTTQSEMRWRPIEEAPHDGQAVLMFDAGDYKVVRWYEGFTCPCHEDGWYAGDPYCGDYNQLTPSHFCFLTPPTE